MLGKEGVDRPLNRKHAGWEVDAVGLGVLAPKVGHRIFRSFQFTVQAISLMSAPWDRVRTPAAQVHDLNGESVTQI